MRLDVFEDKTSAIMTCGNGMVMDGPVPVTVESRHRQLGILD